jgi:hypothetical protein
MVAVVDILVAEEVAGVDSKEVVGVDILVVEVAGNILVEVPAALDGLSEQ